MKRLVVICFLIGSLNANLVYAVGGTNPPNNDPLPFEEMFFKYGYKSVEDALKECENYFKRELKLPIKMPPLAFTHHFGQFNGDDMNGHLDVVYLNAKTKGPDHYKITVRPVEQKLPPSNQKRIIRMYKLKDGTEAVYYNHIKWKLLRFEKSGWQYELGVDPRVEDKVPVETLLEIADSIKSTYPAKLKDPLHDEK